jgi:hypothetical protein
MLQLQCDVLIVQQSGLYSTLVFEIDSLVWFRAVHTGRCLGVASKWCKGRGFPPTLIINKSNQANFSVLLCSWAISEVWVSAFNFPDSISPILTGSSTITNSALRSSHHDTPLSGRDTQPAPWHYNNVFPVAMLNITCEYVAFQPCTSWKVKRNADNTQWTKIAKAQTLWLKVPLVSSSCTTTHVSTVPSEPQIPGCHFGHHSASIQPLQFRFLQRDGR